MLSFAAKFLSSIMGNSFTQFTNALKQGSVSKVLELYDGDKKLRNAVKTRLNESLGPDYNGNTVLHFTAMLKMKSLYCELINEGGKPDMKNDDRRNCLHLICLVSDRLKPEGAREMMRYTLEHGLTGMDVQHVLEEQDKDGNTVLHLAALNGLEGCIELLLSHHPANLYLTNKTEETAADLATKKGHKDIATALETQMVFADDGGSDTLEEPDVNLLHELAEGPTAMKDKELRSMKDQLLIETTQLLGVSLFVAEALLKNHGWSKEQLLEAWMENAEEVCEEAGVQLPSELGMHNLDVAEGSHIVLDEGVGREELECGICCVDCPSEVVVPCGHHFCKDCWKQYLESKILTGDAHNIVCPEYACYRRVPLEVIEGVVSREMAEKFLSFDLKAFVDSNPNIRWCPHPGCGEAITLATPLDNLEPSSSNSLATNSTGKETAKTVHCRNHHYFCWGCNEDPHEPCDCDQWRKWLNHIEDMKPKVGEKTSADADKAASSKWLATRSKPCPRCKIPIEKTEGCNHMCCKKCKHDFCWMCLDEWKHHNSSTGGYFECNRYDAQVKAAELLESRKDDFGDFREWERLSKFLHYYDRFKEHSKSLEFESPYLDKAKHKMEELAFSVQSLEDSFLSTTTLPLGSKVGPTYMAFIEDAVQELLKCRRILRASYGYGYYLEGNTRRRIFESLQGSLEEVTEMLAEVVARPHLRKPRQEIIHLTREAREKRRRFIDEIKYGDDVSPTFLRPSFPWLQDSNSIHDFDEPQPSRRFSNSYRRSHDRSHDTSVPHDSDSDLLRVLELSKQEFEVERKLKDDIEAAKALSIQESSPEPISPLSSRGRSATPIQETPSFDWLQTQWRRPNLEASWPIVKLEPRSHIPSLNHSPSPPPNGDPMDFTPLTLQDLTKNSNTWDESIHTGQNSQDNYDTSFATGQRHSNDTFGGQSSPNTFGGQSSLAAYEGQSAWGPVVSEEADFDRAIELSLKDVPQEKTEHSANMLEIFGPNVCDSNRQEEDGEGVESATPSFFENLPTELRDLLDNSNRSGAHV